MKKLLLFLFAVIWSVTLIGQNLNEGFEGTTFPPAGWSVINLGDANTWVALTAGVAHTGNTCASILYGATAHNDYLITPQLAPVAGNFTIAFWAESYSASYPEQFNVKLSTTGNAVANFTVTLASAITAPGTYTQFSYNLSAYIGQNVYVAIQAISTDEWYLFVDDVTGPPMTPTPVPTAQPTGPFTLTPAVTTVAGSFTAASPAPSGGYLVVRSTSSSLSANPVNGTTYNVGDALGGGIVASTALSTSFTAAGLSPTTLYYFFVFSYNSGGPGPAYLTTGPLTGNTTTLPAIPLCGTKTVGATGCDYVNLTAAMTALISSTLCGPLTLFLNSNYSSAGETWPIVVPVTLGSSATNTITIKPNTGVTASISGALASNALIKVLNSNTIIDGSNTAGGTTQNLTITNTSTTAPTVMVIGSTGTTPVTNVTVKNTIIINGATTSTALFVSDGATLGNTGYFTNITVQNNSIRKAYIGMYCNAVAAAGNGNGLLITGNALNTAGANSIRIIAIYVQGVDGATVSNNTIGNMADANAEYNRAIWFATSTVNSTISGNTISTLSNTNASYAPMAITISSAVSPANITISDNIISGVTSSGAGVTTAIFVFSTTSDVLILRNQINNIKNTNATGYGCNALWLGSTFAGNANISVINNIIWDIAGRGSLTAANSSYNGYGIDINSGTGYKLYFNTVHMNTDQTNNGYPAAINIESGVTTAGAIDLRDNIFSSSQSTGTDRYAIYCGAANTVFSNIDYNDYYTTGPDLGFIGSNRATIADIRTGFGGNVNSLALNPTYVGGAPFNLHPTNLALGAKGVTISGITTDITGAPRTNPPDVGAYQFTTSQIVTTTAATNLTNTTATLNGSITASNLTVAATFQYGLTLSYELGSVAATPGTVTGNSAISISVGLTGLTVNNTYHFRAVGTSGGLVVNGNDMTFSTIVPPVITTNAATLVGATFATLNGSVNPKNASTTVSFEYGTTAGGPYPNVAAVAGPFTGNTVQNFSAALSGLSINTWYYFRAKAVNAVTGSPFYGSELNFFTTCVIPPAPGTISGPPSVCKTVGGYVYSVVPVPYAFVYNWTFPAGFTITSYPNSNVVTVTATNSAVSGPITVRAQSDCGAVGAASPAYNVTVNALPTPTITSGSSPVCQYTSHDYTTQAGNSSYIWSATPDGTITPNGNVATISWPTQGAKTVSVIYTSPAGCTAAVPGTMAVNVNIAPLPHINGNNNMCINSGFYDYTTETGSGISGYVWTVSAGGTITAGQGTADAQVVWNTPGAQYVTVNYNNSFGCSAPSPIIYNVMVNGMPGPAGTITGSSAVCLGSNGIAYYVPPITNAIAYVWSLPAGATVATGDGTNSITVNFASDAVSGDITVFGNSLCGDGTISAPFHVMITQLPLAAGPITGADSVCAGELGVAYSVAPVPNATGYTWNLPLGAFIASGGNTANITVDFAFGASSGNMSVSGTNFCGNGAVSPEFPVGIKTVPPKPFIYATGNTLTSNSPDGNQWYYEGAAILTATGQSMVALYTGWYWDVVTLNGCASDTSNNIYMVVTGMNEPKGSSFVVYPVPNDGQFKLMMNSPAAEPFNISISNNIGVTVYTKENVVANGPSELVIDLRPIPSGVYTMIIRNSSNKVVRKIVVNK